MPVFAGIFSFLGNQVAADNPETIYGVMEDTNSQTMALLEANFSAGSVFGSEKSEKNEAQIDENVDTLISGNALLPQAKLAFYSDQAGYEAGRTDVLNFLDSEEVYLNAKIAYYQALADALKSFAAIERAVGVDMR